MDSKRRRSRSRRSLNKNRGASEQNTTVPGEIMRHGSIPYMRGNAREIPFLYLCQAFVDSSAVENQINTYPNCPSIISTVAAHHHARRSPHAEPRPADSRRLSRRILRRISGSPPINMQSSPVATRSTMSPSPLRLISRSSSSASAPRPLSAVLGASLREWAAPCWWGLRSWGGCRHHSAAWNREAPHLLPRETRKQRPRLHRNGGQTSGGEAR